MEKEERRETERKGERGERGVRIEIERRDESLFFPRQLCRERAKGQHSPHPHGECSRSGRNLRAQDVPAGSIQRLLHGGTL